MPQAQLWIGLVELKPLNRQGSGAAGAFTNIVTWARDLQGFRRNADIVAETVGAYVIDVQGAEPLSERAKSASFTEEIRTRLSTVDSTPTPSMRPEAKGRR
jgi:hypothetical protein